MLIVFFTVMTRGKRMTLSCRRHHGWGGGEFSRKNRLGDERRDYRHHVWMAHCVTRVFVFVFFFNLYFSLSLHKKRFLWCLSDSRSYYYVAPFFFLFCLAVHFSLLLLLLYDLWMSSRNSLSDGQRWPSRRGNETADRQQQTDVVCVMRWPFDLNIISSAHRIQPTQLLLENWTHFLLVSFAGFGRWQLRVIGADSSDCSADMLEIRLTHFWLPPLPLFFCHIEKLSRVFFKKWKENWSVVVFLFYYYYLFFWCRFTCR